MESVTFNSKPWKTGEPLKIYGEYVHCASLYKHVNTVASNTLRRWFNDRGYICRFAEQFQRQTFIRADNLCAVIAEKEVIFGDHSRAAINDLLSLQPDDDDEEDDHGEPEPIGWCQWFYTFFSGPKIKNG